MTKGIITVDVDNSQEMEFVHQWFGRWRNKLEYISENEGCGCCIDSWRVIGPKEAIKEAIEFGIAVYDKPEYLFPIKRILRRTRVLWHLHKQKKLDKNA